MGQELQRPPTRSELNRELMVRAATSWDGLGALALVAGAGVLLQLPVLVPIAVVLWVVASVWHYFDGTAADKLHSERQARRGAVAAARTLDPAALCPKVARELTAARAQEESIRQTIAGSELPSELTGDVDALVQAFERTAGQADRIYRSLERQKENGQGADALRARIADLQRTSGGSADERALIDALSAQLAAVERAEKLRDRFFTTMERMVAELGTIDSEILGMSATEAASAQSLVAGQLRDLRELVGGLSGEMERSAGDARSLPA